MLTKKILIFLISFFVLLPFNVGAISFDEAVLKSVFQIKIYDTELKQDVSWGTGMAIGGIGTILTNYHVAKLAITNPSRYKAYACVVTSLNSKPECKHLLSITENIFGRSIGTPKYDQKFDLALLYMDQIYVNGTWKSWMDVPLADWGFLDVNLSDYIKDYHDLSVGNSVYAIGYPDYGGEKTIQVDGVVTKYFTDQRSGQPLIVSNFKISFGNSGGPVFNLGGELVGVTVACFVDENDRCTDGLFIPLPTVNWWYTNQTNSKINTWEGEKFYLQKSGIPDGVWQSALCSPALRQNAYYDPAISVDSCTCKAGYSKNSNGDCVAINTLPETKICLGVKDASGQCISNDQYCKNKFGSNSYSSKVDLFTWRCITNDQEQPTANVSTRADGVLECSDLVNGYRGSDNYCYCNNGHKWSFATKSCMKETTTNLTPPSSANQRTVSASDAKEITTQQAKKLAAWRVWKDPVTKKVYQVEAKTTKIAATIKAKLDKAANDELKAIAKAKAEEAKKASQKGNDALVSINNSVYVRQSNNAKSKILGTAKKGTSYKFIEEKSGWVKINFNGKEGWVSKSYANIRSS